MALTPLRWIAAAIAGALIVATILFRAPREPWRPDPRDLLARRVQSLGSLAWRTADRARARQIIDSVLPVLARLPKTDTSRIIVDRAIAPGNAAYVARMARRDIVDRPAHPREPVDIVFILDDATSVLGYPRGPSLQTRVDYVLPQAAGERCVVVARVRQIRPDFRFARRSAPRLLGPCAFFEKFGMPGPRVSQWLMQGGWLFGGYASWTVSGSPWLSPTWATFDGTWLRRWMTINAFRCASGDAATCREILAMRAERLPAPDMTITPPRFVSTSTLNDWTRWHDLALGPLQNRLLGDMVRDVGPETFERIWTSNESITEAFRGAAGRDLGDWVTEWASSAYGEHGRGPAVPPSGLLMALGLLAIAGAGAGVSARRRQVR